jgi:hypothetical protein
MAATMQEQLLQLLADTQLPAEGPRKQAEILLLQAQTDPAFPSSLATIAGHASVGPEIRQSALLVLRKFVERNWAPVDEDGNPPAIQIEEPTKQHLQVQILELATSNEADRKIRSAAR